MILDLHQTTKMSDIKRVYRELALKYHPDRNNKSEEDRAKAAEMMALINEAYETLSDPAKRNEYDIEYKENVGVKPKKGEEFKWE